MTDTTKQWLILGALLAIMAAAIYGWQVIHDRRIDKAMEPPAEVKSTDATVKTIERTITEYKVIRERLPEVIENAQLKARGSVDALSDDAVADEWNARLGQYRDKAAGVSTDQ